MPNAKELIDRARMFEERAEKALDPISRQHYREMAAHYRSLSVEYATPQTEDELAHSLIAPWARVWIGARPDTITNR